MRTREQFKAYVYEKADRKMHEQKKSRKIFYKSAVSLSLLLIIGGAFLYSNIGVGNITEECAPLKMASVEDGAFVVADVAKSTGNGSIYGYSYSLDDKAEVQTESMLDVLAIAKNVCTVEYDNYNIEYDEVSKLWKVDFFKSETAGGSQTVYIDENGTVKEIVYGE